jgi:tetratricopeptide (TPR) repeat protein
MRFIIWDDSPQFWSAVAIVLLIVIGVCIYQWLRPPAWQKLFGDRRYHQALSVYGANLARENPTSEERRLVLDAAVEYLTKEQGIPAEEARSNLRLVSARYDRDRSYELRQEAVFYEQAGAYDLALDYYERAARWQEQHDPKDHQFLLGCAARVRKKVRSR